VLKNDRWIREMVGEYGVIDPFVNHQVRTIDENGIDPVISYGLSSYGYDFRISDEFKIFINANHVTADPKNFPENAFVSVKGTAHEPLYIPPNSFALARTLERFRIPRKILTICVGKSTYARCGIIVNVTPFEPEWEGYATLELSNTGPLPAPVYPMEGIAQLLFLEADEECEVSYADRNGRYNRQQGIVLPRV
jgi:dCTP deaminase